MDFRVFQSTAAIHSTKARAARKVGERIFWPGVPWLGGRDWIGPVMVLQVRSVVGHTKSGSGCKIRVVSCGFVSKAGDV